MTSRVPIKTRFNKALEPVGRFGGGEADGSLLLFNIVYSILLMIIFLTIKPGYLLFLIIIYAGLFINWFIMYYWRNKKPRLRSLIKLFIVGSIIYWLAVYTGAYGFLGVVAFVLIVAAYKIFIQKSEYMMALRTIESKIFGKPLDRKNWEPGELKRTKIKFVRRKKNEK